jgi:D-threo-aldose 1-dehydrogenase
LTSSAELPIFTAETCGKQQPVIQRAQRPIAAGRTRVTDLGFGAAPMGNLFQAISDQEARAAIEAVLASGVRYIDTAPYYGFGLSEKRLGAALAELDPRGEIVISSKVGRVLNPAPAGKPGETRHGFVSAEPFEPAFDYSYDGVMRAFESSQRRLRRDKINILLAHDIGRVVHGPAHDAQFKTFIEGGCRAMRALRDQGAVDAIGLGVNEWQVCEEVLAQVDLDVVLLAGRYTLLEQEALDTFLPLCAARNVSVLIAGVFNSGILANGVRGAGPLRYNYEPAPADIVACVGRLQEICEAHGVPLPAAALRFPFAHPQVASVLVGIGSAEQAAKAAALIEIEIPDALWSDLREVGLLRADAPIPSARPTAIVLHEDDNIVVTVADIRAGQAIAIDGEKVRASVDVPVGHKLARRALKVGDKVIKYGAPIGSMIAAAAKGAHVHVHNMKSDYLAVHGADHFNASEAT